MHPSSTPGRLRLGLVTAMIAALVAAGLALITPAMAADTLLSQGKTATASSAEGAAYSAAAAVDGNLTGTRWASAFSDPQWIQVDLGATATVSQVVLTWESAYASAFKIQTSPNATTWTDIYSTTTGTGGTQT
ncbi:discoidin domain-containing protein, partial [Acrocarpospora phusangensis]|uniref:discoidin domain-containing protein n=1 Tax=Acrocarpospora phusangensis TaxID=1070424 RepID=UPI00194F19B3